MKKLIAAIFSIVVFASCGDDDVAVPNLITISTIESTDPDLFKKTVILYEDDKYLIATYFDKYISSYPYGILFGYDELKQKAIQDTVTYDTLQMQDYIRYPNDDTYTLAYHLENGSCLIYNKQSKEIITTIKLENYSSGGPMTTTAGRIFYIEGKRFLETVDLMS